MASADERQEGGDHYKSYGVHQPWNVLQAWLTPEEYRGWQKGVAIVYLARERRKGGDQDIRKAFHHLEKLLETLDGSIEEPSHPILKKLFPEEAVQVIHPPESYTSREGSTWFPWPLLKGPTADDLLKRDKAFVIIEGYHVHAFRWEDGTEWDCINGLRPKKAVQGVFK